MTDPLRRAALIAACGLLLAGPAGAKCFCSSCSTLRPVLVTDFIPSLILRDPGPFTSCFRDLADVPCAFSNVTIDFSPCGGDVEIAQDQESADVFVNCSARTIVVTTDLNGCVVGGPFLARTGIQVAGWPHAPGDAPSRNIGPAGMVGPCAVIYLNGFLMGTVSVHVVRYDSDGDGDVDAGDLAFTMDAVGHFFAGSPPDPAYRTFYDYDWDGDVDAGDASAVLNAMGLYFQGAAAPYQGAYCP